MAGDFWPFFRAYLFLFNNISRISCNYCVFINIPRLSQHGIFRLFVFIHIARYTFIVGAPSFLVSIPSLKVNQFLSVACLLPRRPQNYLASITSIVRLLGLSRKKCRRLQNFQRDKTSSPATPRSQTIYSSLYPPSCGTALKGLHSPTVYDTFDLRNNNLHTDPSIGGPRPGRGKPLRRGISSQSHSGGTL